MKKLSGVIVGGVLIGTIIGAVSVFAQDDNFGVNRPIDQAQGENRSDIIFRPDYYAYTIGSTMLYEWINGHGQKCTMAVAYINPHLSLDCEE